MGETSAELKARHLEEQRAYRDLLKEHAGESSPVQLALMDAIGVNLDGRHQSEKEIARIARLLLPDEATLQERDFIGTQQRQARWFDGADWFTASLAGLLLAALVALVLNLVECKRPRSGELPTPVEVRGANSRQKSSAN